MAAMDQLPFLRYQQPHEDQNVPCECRRCHLHCYPHHPYFSQYGLVALILFDFFVVLAAAATDFHRQRTQMGIDRFLTRTINRLPMLFDCVSRSYLPPYWALTMADDDCRLVFVLVLLHQRPLAHSVTLDHSDGNRFLDCLENHIESHYPHHSQSTHREHTGWSSITKSCSAMNRPGFDYRHFLVTTTWTTTAADAGWLGGGTGTRAKIMPNLIMFRL